ncbi:bifunctional folylpolyglutamate synthase/dihydrofolate synthase [Rhodoflexus caldus]|uniref:bifunctional folylpolyglutamate synthase/dihydrofolate synthase n=1 Tax=Rhodoflexus caldus TaxID=2891236 RepID=UPI002029B4D5|nr:folylpolyglutamate synthase/dihydrofolate synthase family protein [Rhodoflexus caldus]
MNSARFEETLTYLYGYLPMFQRIGAAAFKPDLSNTLALCQHLGNPHERFPSIHVAGTNGKGSSSHLLTAILQAAGYRVGLYTSPHLKSFTERIRINGQEADKQWIIDWVEKLKPLIEQVKPSFFEVTVAMAFDYFAQNRVDIAVVEVGLGGRLDSTNIISPILSLITNISYDHQALLGDTLPQIAFEKAGIIKHHTPVIISEKQEEVSAVFCQKAAQEHAPIYFASDRYRAEHTAVGTFDIIKEGDLMMPCVKCQLLGEYQAKNLAGVMQAVECLQAQGWKIDNRAIRKGIAEVSTLTGLKGRWQIIRNQPLTVCDTAHNEGGLRYVVRQIAHTPHKHLHFVLGVVADKSLDKVLPLLPRSATYYFCKPDLPRGLAAEILQEQAAAQGLRGNVYSSVNQAYQAALAAAQPDDMVFIGGSTFVVAEIEDL